MKKAFYYPKKALAVLDIVKILYLSFLLFFCPVGRY